MTQIAIRNEVHIIVENSEEDRRRRILIGVLLIFHGVISLIYLWWSSFTKIRARRFYSPVRNWNCVRVSNDSFNVRQRFGAFTWVQEDMHCNFASKYKHIFWRLFVTLTIILKRQVSIPELKSHSKLAFAQGQSIQSKWNLRILARHQKYERF